MANKSVRYSLIKALLTGEALTVKELVERHKRRTSSTTNINAMYSAIRNFKLGRIGNIIVEEDHYPKRFRFKKEALEVKPEDLYIMSKRKAEHQTYAEENYPELLNAPVEKNRGEVSKEQIETLFNKLHEILSSGKIEISINHYIHHIK